MDNEPDHFRLNYRQTMVYYATALGQAEEVDQEAIDRVLRDLGQSDLFFLLVFILKRPDLMHPWLFARCREVQREPDGRLDLWFREGFKDLADDTPILTANRGWTTHGEIEIGDKVFAPSGKQVNVLALSERFSGNECFEIEMKDGEKITAGAGHLWRLRKKRKFRQGYWKDSEPRRIVFEDEVLTTKEIFTRLRDKPNSRIDLGASDALEYSKKELPIHPYVLGAWLGDGSSADARITCSYSDMELIDYIRACGISAEERKSSNQNSGLFKLGPNCRGRKKNGNKATKLGVMENLREIGVLNNKHIPERYLTADIEQRFELLHGLMDTDGTCDVGGTATFCNTNEALADGVYALATSLGLKPRKRQYMATLDGREISPVWHITFQAHKSRCPFNLRRKVERCIEDSKYINSRYVKTVRKVSSVSTRCIQVEGGLYLVGKTLVPTHNSTIITFGLTIFDVINNPEITIGIFSHSKGIAKNFLGQIKKEFENNADLKRLWPGVFWENPRSQAPRWSEDLGIIMRRSGNPKEATIEAHGLVDGQPTGRHFELRVYDDVVTVESVATPEQITKVTHAWRMSINLGARGGRERYIGTRYHLFDTYRTMMDDEVAIPRVYPATVDGTEHGEPVLMTRAQLAEKRRAMGLYVFNSQILLNPTADAAMGFKQEWLVHADTDYHAAMRSLFRFILVDPAGGKQRKGNDYTSIQVWGYGLDKKYRLLDMRRDRMNLSQRCTALIDLHQHWRPHLVAYEEYGMQADIEHIRYVQKEKLYEFDIIELGGNMPKPLRILRLVPLFEAKRIILPTTCCQIDYQGHNRDLVKDFVEQEYLAFPVLKHDDMCFVTGTMIATSKGDVPIEKIQIGDKVLTPDGFMPVLAAARTGKKPVISKFGLTGTASHPVFSLCNSYQSLDTIACVNETVGVKLCDWIKIALLKGSFSTAFSSKGWEEVANTISQHPQRTQGVKTLKGCMSIFGNSLRGKNALKATKSIIRTATLLTSSLIIWSAYQKMCIGEYLKKWIWSRCAATSIFKGLKPLYGTNPQKAERGTASILSASLRKYLLPENIYAQNAGIPFLLASPEQLSFAQISVARDKGMGLHHAREKENLPVSCAVSKNSPSGHQLSAAQDHAPIEQDVYNLSVAGPKCYFANGILVHNCDCMARIIDLEGMGVIELPKVQPASTRGNTGFNNLGNTGGLDWRTA